MDGNENESGKRHGSERNKARTRCFRRLAGLLGADAVSHRGLELWVYLMAENVGEEALASLVADKLRKVTAVKAPSSGQAMPQDLAAIMGAEMMSHGTVQKLDGSDGKVHWHSGECKHWRHVTARSLDTAESANIGGM